MKRILLAAVLIFSNSLYGQKSFPWLQGIEGCFTNNYFSATFDFSAGYTPSGTERATLFLSEKSSHDTVALYSSVVPMYAPDKKTATINFSLTDSLYNLLETPDESEGYGNKWKLIIRFENSMRDDTVWTGISSLAPFKDSIKLQADEFFLHVLNTDQHTFDRPFTYQWSKNDTLLATSDTTSLLALANGTYTLLLQSQHCSATYSVPFNPLRYEAGILKAPSVPDAGYQWHYESVPIDGATSNQYAASNIGKYSVEVTFPANVPNSNTRTEGAIVGVYTFEVKDLLTGININLLDTPEKTVLRIYTALGNSISPDQVKSGLYIYQYSDGSTRKVMVTE